MFGAAEGGKLGLEGAHFRAHDELTMIEHTRDRRVDRRTKPPALRGEIDEGNRRQFGAKIHHENPG
jgi:hypothetical protein